MAFTVWKKGSATTKHYVLMPGPDFTLLVPQLIEHRLENRLNYCYLSQIIFSLHNRDTRYLHLGFVEPANAKKKKPGDVALAW